jgi:aspartate/methionine/tyrosine aminotransferase
LDLATATGILTFPGSCFSVVCDGVNPGAGFIRIALIDSVDATASTLKTASEFMRNYR